MKYVDMFFSLVLFGYMIFLGFGLVIELKELLEYGLFGEDMLFVLSILGFLVSGVYISVSLFVKRLKEMIRGA